MRYLRASTARRAEVGEALQRELAREGLSLFRELAAAGLDAGYDETGCLTVHTSVEAQGRAEDEAASVTGRILDARMLSGDEARNLEPALARTVRAAVLFPHEARCDPVRLVRAVGASAQEAGVTLRRSTEAYALCSEPRGVSIETTRGRLRAGFVVLAAGAWSGRLAGDLGVPLPLQGGKGYAIEYDHAVSQLRLPVYMHEERCVVNPMDDRLRVTGGLLLDGLDERFDGRRVDAISRHAERVLGITARPNFCWRGLRPCSPDGLPIVGFSQRAPRVTIATGHGMLGVTLGPLTGRLVADLICGRSLHPTLEALSPERFRPFWTGTRRLAARTR
jgi:D-amino-acid dehydrogenase